MDDDSSSLVNFSDFADFVFILWDAEVLGFFLCLDWTMDLDSNLFGLASNLFLDLADLAGDLCLDLPGDLPRDLFLDLAGDLCPCLDARV